MTPSGDTGHSDDCCNKHIEASRLQLYYRFPTNHSWHSCCHISDNQTERRDNCVKKCQIVKVLPRSAQVSPTQLSITMSLLGVDLSLICCYRSALVHSACSDLTLCILENINKVGVIWPSRSSPPANLGQFILSLVMAADKSSRCYQKKASSHISLLINWRDDLWVFKLRLL